MSPARTAQRRRPTLTLWIGLALLAVFALVGVGDPATAAADPASVATGSQAIATGSFFDLGPRPQLLVMLGLLGLLIFPDAIAPGTRVRRDPSSR